MKSILIPTDFSTNAKNAFYYAAHLAKYIGVDELKLAHVFLPQADTAEYPTFVPPIEEFLKIREQMLDQFCLECQKTADVAGIKLSKELWIGFPVEEIVRKSGEADLIVMGSTGEGGIFNKLFGSISTGVARKAHVPVILVPQDAPFKPIKNILYAANYESVDDDFLEALSFFNRYINATVHFVHVRTQGSEAFEKTKQEIFEELFEAGNPAFAFEIEEVQGKDVAEALAAYLEGHFIDLMVLVTKHRHFIDQLLHRSLTKQMVFHTEVPLLVLPDEAAKG